MKLFAAVAMFAWCGFGAEIRVLSSSNMQPVLADVADKFARESGHTLQVVIAEAVPVRDRIAGGEAVDVAITQRELLEDLRGQGRLAGGVVEVAHSTVAVVVRAGAGKVRIDSVEALRQALLAAESITYPDPNAGGLAGIYFARALERMGIADRVRAKTRLAASGAEACRWVGLGEAQLGIAQKSTARASVGTEVVGLLPRELDVDLVVAAGVVRGTSQAVAAEAFVTFLNSESVAAVLRTRGMEP